MKSAVDRRQPLRLLLQQARKAASDEGVASGAAAFRQAVDDLEPIPSEPGLQQSLLWTGLKCGDLDFVSRLLREIYGTDPTVHVLMQPPGTPPRPRSIIQCAISQPAGLQFEIPQSALDWPGMDLFVARFLKTLPVFIAACRAKPTQHGRTTLDIADAARFTGLGFCANKADIHLLPDPDFMASHGYETFRRSVAEKHVPWSSRRKVAFWRGATTGRGDGTAPRWQSLPRVHLCHLVQGDHAPMFDVGISRLQFAPGEPGGQEITNLGLMRPFVSPSDLQTFRYHIDIDGYTSAWSALFQKLLTGSPVLKVQSPQGWRQWYYDRLQPWVNFVPIKPDMSDLVENTRWLMDNDDNAERIGRAGRLLAESLTYESELHTGAATIRASLR